MHSERTFYQRIPHFAMLLPIPDVAVTIACIGLVLFSSPAQLLPCTPPSSSSYTPSSSLLHLLPCSSLKLTLTLGSASLVFFLLQALHSQSFSCTEGCDFK